METFYITTAIDYVNASPHIGHAYEKVLADVLARWHRLRGDRVFFLTGTDEHGLKIASTAAALGRDVRAFVDENAATFRHLTRVLNLSNDDFIRTTEPRHQQSVRALWARVAAAGDFYKKNYRALYCVGHEAFVTLSDLVDGKCPEHETEPIVIEEENYFFRLSRYRPHLRRLFAERPDFVVPAARANEMLALIDTLEDISVSRPVEKLAWGIPVPGDPSHVIYVWFDALTNYISAIGFGTDEARFRTWWPAYHLIGKGINRFHSLLWPAMLLSAGVEPPRQVLVHGYLTVEGQKISKSLGNVIDPAETVRELATRAGVEEAIAADALRYYLSRDIPFGEDADFSRAALVQRFNADLANDYGNLLNRVLPLVHRHFDGRVPACGPDEGGDRALREVARQAAEAADRAVVRYDLRGALEEIWRLVSAANRYVDEEAPWRAVREGRLDRAGTVVTNTLEAFRAATLLLSPWLPTAARRAWAQLGLADPLEEQRLPDAAAWGRVPTGTQVGPGQPIFPRIEEAVPIRVPAGASPGAGPTAPGPPGAADVLAREAAPSAAGAAHEPAVTAPAARTQTTGGGPQVETIGIDEFRRLDIRVAEVLSANRIAGTDRLLELEVDLGGEVRRIVTGVYPIYRAEDLVGRRIIVLANLEPRRVRGVESQGMLLAAEWEGDIGLLTVDKSIPPGARVT